MKFAEAFELMKVGNPVKLPSWGGYWVWDEEKKTIMMHCREKDSDTGKDVLDIRETQRVEYTLSNILSDDWILATEENTPVMGGEAIFGFDDAIKYLKRGMKVARKGWNGKGMYLFLGTATQISMKAEIPDIVDANKKGAILVNASVIMKTANNELCVGWLASQADMLGEDWYIVD